MLEILFSMFQYKFCAILPSTLLIDNVQILFLKYHKLFLACISKKAMQIHYISLPIKERRMRWSIALPSYILGIQCTRFVHKNQSAITQIPTTEFLYKREGLLFKTLHTYTNKTMQDIKCLE
jgi:hypothetical protein